MPSTLRHRARPAIQVLVPASNIDDGNILEKSPLALFLSDAKLVAIRVLPRLPHIFLPLPRPLGVDSFFVDITPLGLVFQLLLLVITVLLFVPLCLASLAAGLVPFAAAAILAWPLLAVQGSTLIRSPTHAERARETGRRRFSWRSGKDVVDWLDRISMHVLYTITLRDVAVPRKLPQRRSNESRGNEAFVTARKGKNSIEAARTEGAATFTANQQRQRRFSMTSAVEDSKTPATPSTRPQQAPQKADEAWFFINGITTSRSGALKALRHLEELFQRPITGIFNRTLGVLADLVECIVQRDLAYATQDIRTGFNAINKALRDPNVTRVILLAHSQGGIIASLIVDRLLAELDGPLLTKLEVYTFACAANHFSNPTQGIGPKEKEESDSASSSDLREARKSSWPTVRTLGHVEHYANGRDPISQIGVLAFAMPWARHATKSDLCSSGQYKAGISGIRKSNSTRLNHFERPSGAQSAWTDGREPLFDTFASSDANTDTDNPGSNPGTGGLYESGVPRIESAPYQPFHGRVFVRWNASGHLLLSHYLYQGNSILDTPEARKFSRLRLYLAGRSPP